MPVRILLFFIKMIILQGQLHVSTDFYVFMLRLKQKREGKLWSIRYQKTSALP